MHRVSLYYHEAEHAILRRFISMVAYFMLNSNTFDEENSKIAWFYNRPCPF